MFVTFFVAYLDIDTAEIRYSNAGHNPFLIYRRSANSCELKRLKGPLLGIFRDGDYASHLQEYATSLEPGDLILQYTDGLNESANGDGELFNFDRIIEMGNEYASSGAKTLVTKLTEAERRFRGDAPQGDDITLLAMSVCELSHVHKDCQESF
jgi:sigma-B regulation protein RsbU (phosphoserine phosphatase)